MPYLTSDVDTTVIWVDEVMTNRVFFRLPRFERWEGGLVLQVYSIKVKEHNVTDVYQRYQAQLKDS